MIIQLSKLDIDQSALIDEVGEALAKVIIYDSELYQIFNGNEKWSRMYYGK